MKICWDNLENIRLVRKYFKNIKTTTRYKLIDECVICGDPFLSSRPVEKSYCCSKKCRNKYTSTQLKGKEKTEKHKRKISQSSLGKISAFKGKKHSEKSKRKMSKTRKERECFRGKNNPRYGDHRKFIELHGKEKADRLKKAIGERLKGKNNPNYGNKHWIYYKSEEEILKWKQKMTYFWKEKGESVKGKTFEEIYGKEKADEIRKLISISTIENNKKYVPTKYTSGYTGYYKNNFFRSLNELSYLIYLFKNNINFENAEYKKFRIKYKNEDKIWRYYYPDFYLIDTKKLVEIKSKYTWQKDLEKNKCKKYYAKLKYPKYKVLTEEEFEKDGIKLLKKNDLIDMYNNKKLILTKDTINRLKL